MPWSCSARVVDRTPLRPKSSTWLLARVATDTPAWIHPSALATVYHEEMMQRVFTWMVRKVYGWGTFQKYGWLLYILICDVYVWKAPHWYSYRRYANGKGHLTCLLSYPGNIPEMTCIFVSQMYSLACIRGTGHHPKETGSNHSFRGVCSAYVLLLLWRSECRTDRTAQCTHVGSDERSHILTAFKAMAPILLPPSMMPAEPPTQCHSRNISDEYSNTCLWCYGIRTCPHER